MSIEKIISKLTNGRINKGVIDSSFVQGWAEWYRGHLPDFHIYHYWNGKNNVKLELKSLQMAKKVCEDWANLLLNEKCDIVIPEGSNVDNFNKIIDDINFWSVANQSVEQSFALGYGALLLGVNNVLIGDKKTIQKTGEPTIQFVNRFNIVPLTIKNGMITEVYFKSGDDYVVHLLVDGKYVIYNFETVNEKIELTHEFETLSSIAWFQIIAPNISSNYIFNEKNIEPYISIYANATDVLKSLDAKYDSFDNEFIAGRKRIFVTEEATVVTVNQDKQTRKAFDPFSSNYQILPDNGNNDKPFIKDESGELRADSHITAINMDLNLLSDKVGLGEAYYRFNGNGMATATQIVSENSKLFRNLQKQQIPIEMALIRLTIALNELSINFTDKPINIPLDKYQEIKVQFDDSIIEDKGTELNRDKDLVASNLMSPIEFRTKWLAETEEDATTNYRKYFKYELLNKYIPALEVGAITPKEFVKEVYGEEDAEIIKYVTEKVTVGNFNDFFPDGE